MFTPLELEKIEFGSAFMGGYKREDVEDVFNELTNDYETLYKDNIALKDKVQVLENLIDKYKGMEDALQNALLLAQTSSDAAIRSAQEKAENIVKEAEEKAAYILREAEENANVWRQREMDTQQNIRVFAAKNISLLRTQIEILDGMMDKGAVPQVPVMPKRTEPVAPVSMEHTQVIAPIPRNIAEE